jgi:hypothetical protein
MRPKILRTQTSFLNSSFYAKLALYNLHIEDLVGQLYNKSNYE